MIQLDPHIHTVYSGDATGTPEKILKQAIKLKLDAIAITDHNTMKGSIITRKLAKDYDDIKRYGKRVEGFVHIFGLPEGIKIDLDKLFKGGFSTGHGYLREPNDIMSYGGGNVSPFNTVMNLKYFVSEDVENKEDLSFDEAVYGTKKDIKIDVEENCDECHGKGGFDSKTCSECHGSGTVTSEQRTMFGSFLTKTTCPYCHGKGTTYERKCNECHGSGRPDLPVLHRVLR